VSQAGNSICLTSIRPSSNSSAQGKKKRLAGMAQLVEHLPSEHSKHKALSSKYQYIHIYSHIHKRKDILKCATAQKRKKKTCLSSCIFFLRGLLLKCLSNKGQKILEMRSPGRKNGMDRISNRCKLLGVKQSKFKLQYCQKHTANK
jgi:hypothetical protein